MVSRNVSSHSPLVLFCNSHDQFLLLYQAAFGWYVAATISSKELNLPELFS